MFCERATAASRSLSLATDVSRRQGQGQSFMCAGAPSQRSSEHSTSHSKGMNDHWHPACCLQQLLSPVLYDSSFPVITTNVTPQICAVKADDWCRASLRAYPRRRWTGLNSLQWTPERGRSNTYQPPAVLVWAELHRTLHAWGRRQMEKVSLHTGSSLDL